MSCPYASMRVFGGRSCFGPSWVVSWSMISTSRCCLTLVIWMLFVRTFWVALSSISLPVYFITFCLGFPFIRLDFMSAR
jgi:hypothetical protein